MTYHKIGKSTLYFELSNSIFQLTIAEFQSRGRSLADPSPLVSESYASVRRQGKKGSSEIIKFPTLEVRNPSELTFASPVQVSRNEDQLKILKVHLFSENCICCWSSI